MSTGMRFGGSFRALVASPPTGWDPSIKGMSAKPARPPFRSISYGVIYSDRGPITNGQFTSVYAKATGSFEVIDNDFAVASDIVLGNYRVRTYDDYLPGATMADSATAIAAAISLVPGFRSTALAEVVSVWCDRQADDVEFRGVYYGGVVNFDFGVGPTGFLTIGDPSAAPPTLV